MLDTTTRSRWLTLEAVLLILLGIAALLIPSIAGVTAALLFGWILIFSGVFGLASAFGAAAHAHRGWSIASAAIALFVGILLLWNPIAGAAGLSLLIGAYLFLDGMSLIGIAFHQRGRRPARWGWLLVSAIVDIVLAGVVVFLTPAGSTVLIGIIVGIDLIVAGAALLMLQRA